MYFNFTFKLRKYNFNGLRIKKNILSNMSHAVNNILHNTIITTKILQQYNFSFDALLNIYIEWLILYKI